MADDILVDTDTTGGNLSQLEKDLSQAVTARSEGAKPSKKEKKEEPVEDDSLPVKLRGKTPQQIAEMYANLESAYGRMANDLGTQRQMTDRLLDLKRSTDLSNNGKPTKVEIKSAELLDDPTAALERFNADRDAKSEQRLAEMEGKLAAQAFISQHPDYAQIAADQNFHNWVANSPIRARAANAAKNGDWSSASDLLSEWKANKSVKVKTDDDEQDDDPEAAARAEAAKASLESGSQGSPSGGKKGGKIYRRADLMRLKAERPDTYYGDEFQSEILRAYAENRVK